MADFTKRAIRSSFIKLLNEKPLKQISVRDIVDDCGINRNTFYYHFQDIPSLIETILEEDSERLMQDPKLDSIEDCLNLIIDLLIQNRKAVLHIYKSANRDFFEQHHWRICHFIVRNYLDKKLDGNTVSEEDRAILGAYMESLLFGVVMGWLEKGLPEDIHRFVHRLCELKQGDLDLMIEKCRRL